MELTIDWLVGLTFIVGLLSSILSGMAGGGGGFIIIPYFILIGFTPAQALATAKMGSIGTTLGAFTALKGKGLVNKKLVWPFMAMTAVFACISAWLIPQIDAAIFQRVIAVLLIVLIPTLFLNKAAFQPGHRSQRWIVLGFVAYAFFSFAQTLVGTGMGSLIVLVLMFMFGLSALEANATKRVAQSVQGVILFVLLLLQGLVVLTHGLAGILGSVIGSHLGTNFAIKKGSAFVKIILAVMMLTSGVALFFTV